ncbi:MAG: hypothetical protein N2C12_07845, partial [Planctomycetales bacterium]
MDINDREELISAYLDGQLDAEQQQRAEDLIAGDPETAQLLEEFRTVRSSLQSLPKFKLDGAFAQQVLQLAEQAAADDPPETVASVHRDNRDEKRDWRRPLLWSALAIAVAVTLTLINPASFNQLAQDEAGFDANGKTT